MDDDNHNKKQKIIGNYRIGKVLGTGSYGFVRLGVNIITGEQFAIKTLKDTQNRKGIQREISILKLLEHPNIVKLYEVIEDNKTGTFYLVLELATGGELFDYIVARGKLKEKEARKFFRQIVSGVEYCHSNLVIHRDLKPENLLLDSEGNIKINDFGFSNVMTPGERFSTFCGSVSYVAPEIIKNIKYVGPEIDIWSLGVILYTLVCGRLPWPETADGSPAITNIIEGDYDKTPLQHLSTGVQDMLARIMVPDPMRRATMLEIRNHAWINEGYSGPPPCLVSAYDPVIDVNEDVLFQLVQIGFDEMEVRARLKANDKCPEVATYHLLLRKWSSVPQQKTPPIVLRALQDEFPEGYTRPRMHSMPEQPSFDPNSLPPPPARSETPPAPMKMGSGAARKFHANNKRASKRLSYNITAAYADGYKTPLEGIQAALSKNTGEPIQEEIPEDATHPPSLTARRNTMAPTTVSAPEEKAKPTAGSRSPQLAPRNTNSAGSQRRRSVLLTGIESAFKNLMKTEKLKEVKGVFNVDSTTSQTPDQVLEEVKRVLDSESQANEDFVFKYKQKGFVMKCEYPNQRLQFNLEVCKIKSLALTGVKAKRVKGDLWVYKEYCQRLMAKMKL